MCISLEKQRFDFAFVGGVIKIVFNNFMDSELIIIFFFN